MKISTALALAALCSISSGAKAAGHAHQHGVARLDVAVESKRITLALDSPLDNLLGFEHAPRSDAERRLADGAVARLRAAQTMFRIDPAAACTLSRVELNSAPLELGHPDPKEAEEGHADIDASFEFDCVDAGKAAFVDVGLFEFARLRKVEIQVATPRGQFRRDLARPAKRIVLTR